MANSGVFLMFALVLTTIFVAGSIPTIAYSQEGMRSTTSGNSLDVLVEPIWSDDGQARFKVTFLEQGTDTVQVHVDYDLVVLQGDKQVFTAPKPQGQPLLHTAEGVVTIPQVPQNPFKFPSNGDYSIVVSVSGINFIPMNTETATFDIAVTPEFPAGALGAVAAMMTTAIVLARYRKLF